MNVASASGVPPYMIDRHQPARHVSTKAKSPCHIPTFANQLTDEWSLSTRRAVHRPPPSTRPILLHHGLQGYLQTHSIMIPECISKFTRSRPPVASLSSLDLGLQVHLLTGSITACKSITQYALLPPPSASPNSLDHSLGMHL